MRQPDLPPLLIVMGVSGSGKSTVSRRLAHALGYTFVEADDFHSDQAKEQMAQGVPLTDSARVPWVDRLSQHLIDPSQQQCGGIVLAFSGLRRAHRQRLRELPYQALFFHLTASPALIEQRMAKRNAHYMPPELLGSQLATLQSTDAEPDVIRVSVEGSLEQALQTIRERFAAHTGVIA